MSNNKTNVVPATRDLISFIWIDTGAGLQFRDDDLSRVDESTKQEHCSTKILFIPRVIRRKRKRADKVESKKKRREQKSKEKKELMLKGHIRNIHISVSTFATKHKYHLVYFGSVWFGFMAYQPVLVI